jgi:cysteine synthase A
VLRAHRPGVRIVAVEPAASPVLAGGEPGHHHIEGIGAGFVPGNLDRDLIDEIVAVRDDEAAEYTRALAQYEGLLLGISSGANCAAAVAVARRLGRNATVATVFCDLGERYLRTGVFRAEGI